VKVQTVNKSFLSADCCCIEKHLITPYVNEVLNGFTICTKVIVSHFVVWRVSTTNYGMEVKCLGQYITVVFFNADDRVSVSKDMSLLS
jgi:hypothetical protein